MVVQVTEGDVVVVDHVVTNFGDITDTQDIDLDVDGTTEDTNTNVQLDPDETYRGQLAWVTGSGDAQSSDYNVCVVTEDGNEDCSAVNVDP